MVRCWTANLVPPAAVNALLTLDNMVAVAVSSAFAGGAWLLRGVTAGGASAGFVIAAVVYIALGPGGFASLLAVFLVAWATTRIGHRRKQQLGVARDAGGRSAQQVAANLGAAAVFAVAAHWTRHPVLVVAAVAALAEAAADTAASECGEALSARAYMITSWRMVTPGTDGGISAPGTLAAMAAAVLIGATAAGAGVIAWSMLPVVAGAAVFGTFVDSVLGATLEQRGMIGNNSVNFASTMAAAVMALVATR